ncbi:MAG: hypothetical protein WBM75_00680 [Polyangiales bacterium]
MNKFPHVDDTPCPLQHLEVIAVLNPRAQRLPDAGVRCGDGSDELLNHGARSLDARSFFHFLEAIPSGLETR